jgi:hypothetical protein
MRSSISFLADQPFQLDAHFFKAQGEARNRPHHPGREHQRNDDRPNERETHRRARPKAGGDGDHEGDRDGDGGE